MKLLFLLKRNDGYGDQNASTSKSGLLNSALITAHELERQFGVETSVRICQDANGIDREVRDFKPDVCIIEAIWVLPEKFEELRKIYPNLNFIVRVHSEIPFLSGEGEALTRIYKYINLPNVYVAFNSKNTYKNFHDKCSILYLPNLYYQLRKEKIGFWEDLDYHIGSEIFRPKKKVYDIGCFGAIRPLKNQLLQAFAAVHFGDKHDVRVRFHINSSRVEQGGEGTLKNIRALFKEYPQHDLVEHGWMSRKMFLHQISKMELGMQLSFNESFNIVTADFVKERVPIIVSSAIDWMPEEAKIDTELISEIVNKMEHTLLHKDYIVKKSTNALQNYNLEAITKWRIFA